MTLAILIAMAVSGAAAAPAITPAPASASEQGAPKPDPASVAGKTPRVPAGKTPRANGGQDPGGGAASPHCIPLTTGRIRLADLAAAVPAFSAAPPDAAIAYAPAPGTHRTFSAAELTRLARQFGVTLDAPSSVCFARHTAPLSAAQIAAAMRASLNAPETRIEILETSRFPAPDGELVFPREGLAIRPTGGTAVWNGYVAHEGGRFAVWARVRIAQRQHRVVAEKNLKPGQPIEAGDVRLEETSAPPVRQAFAESLEAVVGRLPRRTIAAGAAILTDTLEPPYAVEKGDGVHVLVRGPGAVLKLEGRAEAAGRPGDTVPVRNMESGKIFRARVEDKGRVVVEVR